jgi:hypothetical protein
VKVGTYKEESLMMKFYEYDDQLLCVIKAWTLFITLVTIGFSRKAMKSVE